MSLYGKVVSQKRGAVRLLGGGRSSRLRGKDAISPAASTVCTQMQAFAASDRS